jgi:hypothetical protein
VLRAGYGSYVKATDGVIIQFVSATGERRTLVARGTPNTTGPIGDEGVKGSLLRAIAEMETWPGEWKVETISTPATILCDLQGDRTQQVRRRHDTSPSATAIQMPEQRLLSGIGRIDLLAS